MRLVLSIILGLTLCLMFGAADAATPKRYASIVVDADSLEIIHARQIDELRYPASLTKVMALYLTFDAINAGELRLDERLTVSTRAAKTPPTGLGLRRGQTLSVDQAIQAVAVRSANDAAVVLAERLAGSEELFAIKMTQKARDLGMYKTTFKTANGLPHPEQQTSARDMAKLAMAILSDHKRYYHYFGQTDFSWKGRTRKNTNSLLHWLAGVDGFKTGFTNDSGYNLIISGQRDGRRIIAVVLGGASGKSRDKHMQDLVERGFATLGVKAVSSRPPVTVRRAVPKKTEPIQAVASAVQLRRSGGEMTTITHGVEGIKLPGVRDNWSVQVGAFSSTLQADNHLSSISKMAGPGISGASKSILPIRQSGQTLYRARYAGLTSAKAHLVCQNLSKAGNGCLVIAPGG